MRTFLASALLVFLSLSCSARSGDAIEGEQQVRIPNNTYFETNAGSEGTNWNVHITLDARYRYSGVMGEALYNFCTKMTMNSVTASKALTYTDPESGQTATAPTVFHPGDPILDELGARKAFDNIKLLKAHFAVYLGIDAVGLNQSSLTHVFWDQEVFAPSREWGTNLGMSSPQWKAFLTSHKASVPQSTIGPSMPWSVETDGWERMQQNSYTPDELKLVKRSYAAALKSNYVSGVWLLTNPKPEFTGLLEFENAIMTGLRNKVKKEKPAVTAADLKKAFGGENKKEPPKDQPVVTAADLKKAFGGTAVDINEKPKNTPQPSVTAADLKKAFAQTPKPEPEKSAATLVIPNTQSKPPSTKVVDPLGEPPGWLSCSNEHNGGYHQVHIINRHTDRRTITIKLYPPDTNQVYWRQTLEYNSYTEINTKYDGRLEKFKHNCHNFRIQIDNGPLIKIRDLELKYRDHGARWTVSCEVSELGLIRSWVG